MIYPLPSVDEVHQVILPQPRPHWSGPSFGYWCTSPDVNFGGCQNGAHTAVGLRPVAYKLERHTRNSVPTIPAVVFRLRVLRTLPLTTASRWVLNIVVVFTVLVI